jgi:hypothetical protein
MALIIWAALLVFGIGIALSIRAQSAKRSATRAAYLDAVVPLFTAPLTAIAPSGFPRISGQFETHLFDLQVVADTLTYRKLPALWLLVTLTEPTTARATLNVMLRPMGVETFSNFRDLRCQITPPPDFPADSATRTDDPTAIPDAELVARHLAKLDQNHLKELVITPKGLRITWLIEEADRTRYLAFRDSEMGLTPLPSAQLIPLLHALIELQNDLKANQ